jgi:hypothetical protein
MQERNERLDDRMISGVTQLGRASEFSIKHVANHALLYRPQIPMALCNHHGLLSSCRLDGTFVLRGKLMREEAIVGGQG